MSTFSEVRLNIRWAHAYAIPWWVWALVSLCMCTEDRESERVCVYFQQFHYHWWTTFLFIDRRSNKNDGRRDRREWNAEIWFRSYFFWLEYKLLISSELNRFLCDACMRICGLVRQTINRVVGVQWLFTKSTHTHTHIQRRWNRIDKRYTHRNDNRKRK